MNDDLRLYNSLTRGGNSAYNAIGRTSGRIAASGPSNDNFFTKRASSIGNAVGTTLSAPVSLLHDIGENIATQMFLGDSKSRMNDVAKKYGYNTYHDVWDARDKAEAAGDQATLDLIDNTINPELQAQANANASEATAKAKGYEDYRKNNLISQNINQDRGKFAGSAINTLSTMADVLLPSAGVAFNSVQGGLEGVADELEQSGFKDFDWGRAGQNALVGAATGGVVGAFNKGLSNSLAKRGGNLFKGGNAVTRGLNDLGSKTALGRVGSTIATGAGRGALSGAVGGATGAGLSAALNNQDVLGSALQGAVQGAKGGAVTGGIMAGANMAISRTPGAGKFMRDVNQAQEDWRNSGSNFDERLTKTLTSGDSAVGDWLMGKRQSNILGAAGNLGNRVQDVGDTLENVNNLVDNTGRKIPPEIAQRLADIDPRLLDENGNIKVMYHGTPNGGFERFDDGTYFTADKEYADVYQNPSASSLMPKEGAKNPMTYDTYIDAKRLFDINDSNARKIYIDDYIKGGNANGIDPYRTSYDDVNNIDWTEAENLREFLNNNPQYGYDGIIVDEGGVPNDNGGVTYRGKSVVPMSGDQVIMRESINQDQTPTTASLARGAGYNNEAEAWEAYAKYKNNLAAEEYQNRLNSYNAAVEAKNGDFNYNDKTGRIIDAENKYVPPKYSAEELNEWLLSNQQAQTPTTAKGWLKKAGQRIVEDINNKGVGLSIKDVSGDGNVDFDEYYQRQQDAGARGAFYDKSAINEYTSKKFPGLIEYLDENGYEPNVLGKNINSSGTERHIIFDPKDGNLNDKIYVQEDGSMWLLQDDPANLSAMPTVKKLGVYQSQTPIENPSTELYRTVTGETEQPRASSTDLMYGESELGNRTKRGMIANGMERLGNTLEGAQTNVTRAAAKDIGIESPGKVVENVRKKTGLTNLETQADFAKEITGGENSLLDNIQRIALTATEDGSTYSVDTTPVVKEVGAIVDKYADSNTFGSPTAKERFVRNLKKDIANGGSDILSISNRMKASAADLRGKGVGQVPAPDAAKAKIYTEVAGALDDLSYKAIPQDNVDAMFDTAISEMRGRATQAANNGNMKIAKAWGQSADSLAAQPRTIKNFRNWKKDFVDVSKVNKLTLQAENGAAAQMGRSFGGGVKRLVGTLAQRPVNTLLAKAGGAINSIADRISGDNVPVTATTVMPTETMNTNTYSPSTRLYDAIGRTEGLTNAEQARTANYLANAAQEAEVVPKAPNAGANTLEGLISPTTSGNATSVYNSIYGTGDTQTASTGYFQPTGDYWTDILGKAMSAAIDADDVTAFASLYGMYQDAISKSSSNKTVSDLSATQQAQLAKLDSASSAIDELEMLFDRAGGGKGPILGNLQSIGGDWGLDSNARTYNQLSEGLVNQIALAIGKTDSLNTEGEVKRALQLIPQLTDDATTAKNKLEELRRMLATTKSSYDTAYGLSY